MHGGFAAQEVVVEQKVATHAHIESLQGVSPVKGLLPFLGIARTWTESAHGMLSIVDFDARNVLLGIRRDATQAVAFVANGINTSLELKNPVSVSFQLLGRPHRKARNDIDFPDRGKKIVAGTDKKTPENNSTGGTEDLQRLIA